jgi:hypothetical protein
MRLFSRLISILALGVSMASAATLFRNGDPTNSGPNGSNFLDCANCRAATGVRIFDDFTISAAPWEITAMFGYWHQGSNVPPLPLTAEWEIRTGVSAGVAGTIVANGSGPISWTGSGLVPGLGFPGYYGQIDLSTPIVLGPGTYWMNIAPVLTGIVETFLVGTNGAGGINSSINGTSYVNGWVFGTMTDVGAYQSQFSGRSTYDFSYGVIGTQQAVPEPATALIALAGLAVLLRRR